MMLCESWCTNSSLNHGITLGAQAALLSWGSPVGTTPLNVHLVRLPLWAQQVLLCTSTLLFLTQK